MAKKGRERVNEEEEEVKLKVLIEEGGLTWQKGDPIYPPAH